MLKYSIAPLKTRLSNGHLNKDQPHWPYAYTYGGRRLHELFLAGRMSLQCFTVWLPNNNIVSSPYCNLLLQPVTIIDGKDNNLDFQRNPLLRAVHPQTITCDCTLQQQQQLTGTDDITELIYKSQRSLQLHKGDLQKAIIAPRGHTADRPARHQKWLASKATCNLTRASTTIPTAAPHSSFNDVVVQEAANILHSLFKRKVQVHLAHFGVAA